MNHKGGEKRIKTEDVDDLTYPKYGFENLEVVGLEILSSSHYFTL